MSCSFYTSRQAAFCRLQLSNGKRSGQTTAFYVKKTFLAHRTKSTFWFNKLCIQQQFYLLSYVTGKAIKLRIIKDQGSKSLMFYIVTNPKYTVLACFFLPFLPPTTNSWLDDSCTAAQLYRGSGRSPVVTLTQELVRGKKT